MPDFRRDRILVLIISITSYNAIFHDSHLICLQHFIVISSQYHWSVEWGSRSFAERKRNKARTLSLNGKRLLNGRALKIVLERMIEITADLSKFPEVSASSFRRRGRSARNRIPFRARRKIEIAAKTNLSQIASFLRIRYADFPRLRVKRPIRLERSIGGIYDSISALSLPTSSVLQQEGN